MTTLLEHYPWLKSLWTTWFFVLFVGVITWTMWPSRRETWTKRGEIPFADMPKDQQGKDR